jgi:ABC-2 type transport system permease protein
LRKIFLIARRDYVAAVRTKAFLIGLLLVPILFGGSFFATTLLKSQPSNEVRRVAIADETSTPADEIIAALKHENGKDAFDQRTGARIAPVYRFENVPFDRGHSDAQRLALSNRVRAKELFAFIEIADDRAQWYSNEAGFDEARQSFDGRLNDALRRRRLRAYGIDADGVDRVLRTVPIESMNLVVTDAKSGRIVPATKRGNAEGFAAPFVLAILFFMIVLLTSAPMLTAVAEDKTQRVFEMLLASTTPLQLIGGKVVAAIATALTSSIFYIIGVVVAIEALAISGIAPLNLLPWFLVYLVAEVMMLASMATALGSACSSARDTENFKMFVIFPVMIPILFLTPVLQQPNGSLATLMSFFALFTPVLMLVRQAAPGGVPFWQPWVGLLGAVACTLVLSWLAARIFRIGILSTGKTPNIGELLRWSLKTS